MDLGSFLDDATGYYATECAANHQEQQPKRGRDDAFRIVVTANRACQDPNGENDISTQNPPHIPPQLAPSPYWLQCGEHYTRQGTRHYEGGKESASRVSERRGRTLGTLVRGDQYRIKGRDRRTDYCVSRPHSGRNHIWPTFRLEVPAASLQSRPQGHNSILLSAKEPRKAGIKSQTKRYACPEYRKALCDIEHWPIFAQ
jgi:hypothetical protein